MPGSEIKLGSILWAAVDDPDTGQQLGEHPVVVLSKQAEIDAGDDLRVVVCSTSFSFPLRSGWFVMPHTPGKGHPITGLEEACVVKATWPQKIPQSKINRNPGKRAPAQIVRQLINWLRHKDPNFL